MPDPATIADVLHAAIPRSEAITEARRMLESYRQQRAAYRDGLCGEHQSLGRLRRRYMNALRQLSMNTYGRPIDLLRLLAQTDLDDEPVWTVVDPTQRICLANGRRESDTGDLRILNCAGKVMRIDVDLGVCSGGTPGGVPALPTEARELITNQKIRSRARWVGVLYRMDEWAERSPDLAVVAEWDISPDTYHCLAVWAAGGSPPEPQIVTESKGLRKMRLPACTNQHQRGTT